MTEEETLSMAEVWKKNDLLNKTESMDIYTQPGSSVVFLGRNGYVGQLEEAKALLEVGGIYVVESISVSSWSTSIRLVGFPNRTFNSVMFGNVAT